MIISRSITHDYEQVHNLTDGETDSGMFKNLGYLEPDTKQLNTYSQIMRNNEELLASHLRLNPGSESGDHLVSNNTHTSQVSSPHYLTFTQTVKSGKGLIIFYHFSSQC